MKIILFEFADSGETKVADSWVRWSYKQTASVRLHENTETFSCRLLGPGRMSLHDLKRKLKFKLRAGACAEARQRFVEKIDAEQRAQALIGARPMAVDELVR